jgi:hypothetical protein
LRYRNIDIWVVVDEIGYICTGYIVEFEIVRGQKMRQLIMLDEGLRILEEGIVKANNILIGHPPKSLFSGEDYMKFYKYPFDFIGFSSFFFF